MQQSAGNTTTVVTAKSPDSKASQTFWSQNLFIFLKILNMATYFLVKIYISIENEK